MISPFASLAGGPQYLASIHCAGISANTCRGETSNNAIMKMRLIYYASLIELFSVLAIIGNGWSVKVISVGQR